MCICERYVSKYTKSSYKSEQEPLRKGGLKGHERKDAWTANEQTEGAPHHQPAGTASWNHSEVPRLTHENNSTGKDSDYHVSARTGPSTVLVGAQEGAATLENNETVSPNGDIYSCPVAGEERGRLCTAVTYMIAHSGSTPAAIPMPCEGSSGRKRFHQATETQQAEPTNWCLKALGESAVTHTRVYAAYLLCLHWPALCDPTCTAWTHLHGFQAQLWPRGKPCAYWGVLAVGSTRGNLEEMEIP